MHAATTSTSYAPPLIGRRFLLRNFADEREQLVVHRADEPRQRPGLGPNQLRSQLVLAPTREPDHVSLEKGMVGIEGAAAAVVADLRANRARSVRGDQREVLSFLIALQWMRSRFLLMVIRRDMLGRDTAVDDTNRTLGLLNIVTGVLAPWMARKRDTFDPKERFCSIESRLAGWYWRAFRPTELRAGHCAASTGPGPGAHPARAPAPVDHSRRA